MQPPLIPLESLQIASPCRADWDAMQGNDCVRFCPSCGKNVYDLSAMTRDEAQRLIATKEGIPCLRMRRRSDGTVITDDCPVGSATHKRQKRGVQLLAGVLGCIAAILGVQHLLAARSSTGKEPNINPAEIAMGFAGPASDDLSPNAQEIHSSTPDVLGVGAPSSVTASGQEPTSVTMGVPIMPDPTPTPAPDDTIKIPPIPSP